MAGWRAALRRAEDAPQLLRPGLLAAQIPGGAAYAGITGAERTDGVIAADREGQIAAVSLGSERTLLARIAALRAGRRLVVADLPGGAQGLADLRALSERRPAGELLIVLQRAPDAPGHELLWVAAAGLRGGGGRELTSHTTNQRGLIAAVDLAPTILDYLGLRPIPADMRGERMETDGSLQSASLRSLMARLGVVGGRRLKALGCLLSAWALLLLASTLLARPRRRAAAARAMRVGGLAVLWTPVAALIGAAHRAERGGRVRDDHARLPGPCGAHRRARAMAARAAGAGDRGDPRAGGRCARRHPAAGALAARPQPDPRRALLRLRQRAQVRPGRARAGGRRRGALPGRGAIAGRRSRWRVRACCWRRSRGRPGSGPAWAA